MQTLYTVTYDCGDYYCDGMHLVGVFREEAEANDIAEIFKNNPQDLFPGTWISADCAYTFTVAPIEVGKPCDGQ